MTVETGFLTWILLFTLATIFLCIILIDWCKNTKAKTKFIFSALFILVFLVFSVFSMYASNPNNFTGDVENITITKLDEVYKSNISNQNFSCYYVSKLDDDSIYEIVVSNVSHGSDNFVITKEYEKGSVSYELVVTDIENIPPMKNFNN